MELKVEKIGDVAVVLLEGEALDAASTNEFKKNMESLIAENSKVVFDMKMLGFVDSSGLGAILSCLRQLKAKGGELKICALSAAVRGLFELVRMHRIFDIFDTKEEALESFQG